ncbi:protein kinase subdomain-containing protein PKL [Lentinus brumalis]|uniref:Protein kinase subdomain-containing protein PKL n=1 Tax=Lentinus brumalis TaxID=2498619 RepID=A0A371DSF4_9APHY|nr:protein kinase subdomain-containing protein PKL [Polyporus brumalis]
MVPARLKVALYRQLAQASARFGHQLYTDVFRLPFNLLLKSSIDSAPNEGCGLQIAGSIPGVHVPFLIDYVTANLGSYTLMTWIDGDCCADIWDQLTPADKARIVMELRTQFGLLHKQTAARNRTICASSGAPVSDPRVPWVAESPRLFFQPSDFLKEVWLGLDFPRQRDTVKPVVQPLVDRNDVPIVFCHGDLLPKNIILPGGLASWRSGTTPVYLIDWEYSGWMPLPWDALKATWLICDWDEEWYAMMREVFPESSAELEADWLWRSQSGIPIV